MTSAACRTPAGLSAHYSRTRADSERLDDLAPTARWQTARAGRHPGDGAPYDGTERHRQRLRPRTSTRRAPDRIPRRRQAVAVAAAAAQAASPTPLARRGPRRRGGAVHPIVGSVSGEFELIAAIRERLAAGGAPARARRLSCSAAATMLRSSPARGRAPTSVDALIEGVHFEVPPFTLREVGRKALAVALSDLAAMGAAPGEAYVQLGVTADATEDELLELAAGRSRCSRPARCGRRRRRRQCRTVLTVAVTVVGRGGGGGAWCAAPARRPGDLVVVTGELGGAAAGLLVLRHPELADASGASRSGRRCAGASSLRAPRVGAGARWRAPGASAMIDISDGLGADAGHLAAAGAVRIEIDVDEPPGRSRRGRGGAPRPVPTRWLLRCRRRGLRAVGGDPAGLALEPAQAALGAGGLGRLTAIGRGHGGSGGAASAAGRGL